MTNITAAYTKFLTGPRSSIEGDRGGFNLVGVVVAAAGCVWLSLRAGRIGSAGCPSGRFAVVGSLAKRMAASLVLALVLALVAPAGGAAQEPVVDVYDDVGEDAWYYEPVAALAVQGVFAGTDCDEGFCPDEPLKRWQMAVWLVRILDGADPAPVAESRFQDVDAAQAWAALVGRLAELEVTVGCRSEPLQFCPGTSVSRAQMAVFLYRAFDLSEAAEPAGFSDVAGDHWAAGQIDALAASGITAGCRSEPFSYCPSSPVSKAQMATFLFRVMQWQREQAQTGEPDGGGGGGTTGGGVPPPPPPPPPPDECGSADVGSPSLGGDFTPLQVDILSVSRRATDVVLSWEMPPPVDWRHRHGRFRLTLTPTGSNSPQAREFNVTTSALTCTLSTERLGRGRWLVEIAAVNRAGEGRALQRLIKEQGASAPRGFTAISRLGSGVELSWEAPSSHGSSPIIEYRLWWTTGRGWPSQPQATLPATARSYRIVDLEGGEYVVLLTPFSDTVPGESARQTFTVLGIEVVPVDGSLKVSWPVLAADATGYEIEWKLASQPQWSGAGSVVVASDVRRHVLDALSPNAEYTVRVRALTNPATAHYLQTTATTLGYPAPRNVRVIGLLKGLEIHWDAPEGANADEVRSYVLDWRSNDPSDDSAGRIEMSASERKRTIEALVNGTEYSVLISAVDDQGVEYSAPEQTGRPRTVYQYIQDEFIDPKLDDAPWLSEAWYGVPVTVYVRENDNSCWASALNKIVTLTNCSYRGAGFVLHELAHHYSMYPQIHSGNVDGRLAVISVWLWLKAQGYNDAVERYAGELTGNLLNLERVDLTQDRYKVFTGASEGTIPDWFYDTYTSDGTLATVDHDRLWADMRKLRCDLGYGCYHLGGTVADHAKGLFGGLCSIAEARGALWAGTTGLDYHGPWVDGGCLNRRPENLAAAAGASGELSVSWGTPLWSTGPTINMYSVQWKSGSESYDTTRKATVTDLNDLTHTISGLTSGTEYTIRVTAANSANPDSLTDNDGHSRSSETTATAP